MKTTVDVLQKVNTGAFCALAVACLLQWRRRRTASTTWAAVAFGSLGAIGVIGLALESPRMIGITLWLVKGLLVVLILFPYFLYRFTSAFERPPGWVRAAAGTVTVTAVGWTLSLSRFPIPGLPQPPEWAAYRVVINIQWSVLFAIVALRLWRAGRGEATVPRRRIRTLALAAVGLNVAVFSSGFSSGPPSLTVTLVTQLVSLACAALFFIGLAPPAWLLYVWRRPESLAFQRATGALFRATSQTELSEILLPRAAGMVGARGAAMVSPDGVLLGSSGHTDTPEAVGALAVATDLPDDIHRVDLKSGTLLLWTSPYAPFFGAGELAMTRALGVYADTVVERCALASQQKEIEAALAYQANHDALTGLPNRNLFLDRLTQALAGLSRRDGTLSVQFLDLDRFKIVNDVADHGAGDDLLIAVADRLTAAVRGNDTVARFGGDEFVILAEVSAEAEALALAGRVVESLQSPFRIGGREFTVTASVGVALADDVRDPAVLVRNADAAMYRAKELGRARVEVYDEAMRLRAVQRAALERALRRSTTENALSLFYQPVVRLADGAVAGVEALVRWQHPRFGLLAPASFIPVAEQSDLIVDVGTWVLNEACRQAKAWQQSVPEFGSCVVWMNVSAAQFTRMDVAAVTARALASAGLDPSALGLEITETVFVDYSDELQASLRALHELGVRIAIDDFGTGFSSMSSLKRFPAQVLKIDESFVRGIGSDPEDAAIAAACIALSRSLGLATVAEGVHDAEQSRRLAEMGCEFGQGHYFSPALPAKEAEGFLRGEVLASAS